MDLGPITHFQFDAEKIISASDDETIKIWDFSTGKCIKTIHGHEGNYCCFVFFASAFFLKNLHITDAIWAMQYDEEKIITGNVSFVLISFFFIKKVNYRFQ